MSKPAKKALDRILARHPTATVVARDRKSVTADVGGGKKALVTSIGAMHYDDAGEWREIDTTWQPASGEFQHEMLNGPYLASARSAFNAGQVVEYKARSGEWVRFQPLALNWRDENNSQQQIGIPQAVATQVTGEDSDVLSWPNAYGSGRHFEWRAHPTRLQKLLRVDAASDLPEPAPYLGANIDLELTFAFTYDTAVTAFVDGVAWNRSTTVTSGNAIEFRNASGETLWHFTAPRAWDSAEEPTEAAGVMSFYRVGNVRHVSVRIPRAFVDAATFPIFVDPTVDVDIAAGADDGQMTASMNLASETMYNGRISFAYRHVWTRFANVAVAQGSTVTEATVTFQRSQAQAYFPVPIDISLEDVDSATSVADSTSLSTFNAMSWHATPVAWNITATAASFTTPNIAAMTEDVLGRAGWASGNAIGVRFMHAGTTNSKYVGFSGYENTSYDPASLYVDYTEASAGTTYDGSGASAAAASHAGAAVVALAAGGALAATATAASASEAVMLATGASAGAASETGSAEVPATGELDLYAQVLASDETTPLTDRVLVAADAALGGAYADFAVDFTIQGTPTQTDWDGAVLKLEWVYGGPGDRAMRVTTAQVTGQFLYGHALYDGKGTSVTVASSAGAAVITAVASGTTASETSSVSAEGAVRFATGAAAAVASEAGDAERVINKVTYDATGTSAAATSEVGDGARTLPATGSVAVVSSHDGAAEAVFGAVGASAADAFTSGDAAFVASASGAAEAESDEAGAGVPEFAAAGASEATASETGGAQAAFQPLASDAASASDSTTETGLFHATGASAADASATGAADRVEYQPGTVDAEGVSAVVASDASTAVLSAAPTAAMLASASEDGQPVVAAASAGASATDAHGAATASVTTGAAGDDAAVASETANATPSLAGDGASAAEATEGADATAVLAGAGSMVVESVENGTAQGTFAGDGTAGANASETGDGSHVIPTSGANAVDASEDAAAIVSAGPTASAATTATSGGAAEAAFGPLASDTTSAAGDATASAVLEATASDAAVGSETGWAQHLPYAPGVEDASGRSESAASESGSAEYVAVPDALAAAESTEAAAGILAGSVTGASATHASQNASAQVALEGEATGAATAAGDASGNAVLGGVGASTAVTTEAFDGSDVATGTGSSASTASETGTVVAVRNAAGDAAADITTTEAVVIITANAAGEVASTTSDAGAGAASLAGEGAVTATGTEAGASAGVDSATGATEVSATANAFALVTITAFASSTAVASEFGSSRSTLTIPPGSRTVRAERLNGITEARARDSPIRSIRHDSTTKATR